MYNKSYQGDFMNEVVFKEIVELFVNSTIYELKHEYETPNLNFKFKEDGFRLFEYVMKNPFVMKGYWTPNIQSKDIKFIRENNDDNVPSVFVNDSVSFFEYLTEISNSLIKLYCEYNEHRNARELSIKLLRRIWLRMGIEDISNVNIFLKKQLEFANNRTLDTHAEILFTKFYGYDVSMRTVVNRTWDESTRSMIFRIHDDSSSYELPHIMYDIDENNVCYIYAIQNGKRVEKDKKIERKLYKLNDGIKDPNLHPNKVFSMILFIKLLKEKGIKKMRIPSMQVLSYRYHELLSKRAKDDLESRYEKLQMYPNDKYCIKFYLEAKEWYNYVSDKEDYISYLKTEELINLMYRILEQEEIDIVNETGLQGDYLEVMIK